MFVNRIIRIGTRVIQDTLRIEDSIGHRDYIAKGANYEFCSLNTWPVLVLWLIYDRDFNVPREVVRSIITLAAVSKQNFTGSPREFCRVHFGGCLTIPTICFLPFTTVIALLLWMLRSILLLLLFLRHLLHDCEFFPENHVSVGKFPSCRVE